MNTLIAQFTGTDSNGDGKLSLDELRGGQRNILGPAYNDQMCCMMFQQLDINQDGALDLREYLMGNGVDRGTAKMIMDSWRAQRKAVKEQIASERARQKAEREQLKLQRELERERRRNDRNYHGGGYHGNNTVHHHHHGGAGGGGVVASGGNGGGGEVDEYGEGGEEAGGLEEVQVRTDEMKTTLQDKVYSLCVFMGGLDYILTPTLTTPLVVAGLWSCSSGPP